MSSKCCGMGEGNVRGRSGKWGGWRRGARSAARKGAAVAGWVLPGAVLALMPKCPLCLAGYVVVLTGIGFSASTIEYARRGVVFVCVLCLAVLSARLLWRGVRWRRRRNVKAVDASRDISNVTECWLLSAATKG